jgi:hypothetical protein
MNHLSKEQQALLMLLRISLWRDSVTIPPGMDWELVGKYAKEQGVLSFLYDGAVAAKAEVPAELLTKWKNTTFQGVIRNERLLRAQDELITWFDQAGVLSVVLKGSSVARYYPQPDLRVLGDIDILVNKSDVDKARKILEEHGYVFHESDHEFHMGFTRPGSYVELHYNVTKLPDSAGGRATGKVIDTFLSDINQSCIGNYRFPVLSETNQAVMLLLHMIRHMFEFGIGLRQLCDWAVYMASVDKAYFTNEVLPILEQCGLRKYAEVAAQSCIKDLGLKNEDMIWCAGVREEECRSFMVEVFRLGNMGSADLESMGSLFTDSDSMGNNQSSVKALLSRLTILAFCNFPITKKIKVLLPIAWIYLPLRYFVRMMWGKRPRKSFVKVMESAWKRRKLYDRVKAFDIDK